MGHLAEQRHFSSQPLFDYSESLPLLPRQAFVCLVRQHCQQNVRGRIRSVSERYDVSKDCIRSRRRVWFEKSVLLFLSQGTRRSNDRARRSIGDRLAISLLQSEQVTGMN
jgi:hypothetical protein